MLTTTETTYRASVNTIGMDKCCFRTAVGLPIWYNWDYCWEGPKEWMYEGSKAECKECKKDLVFKNKRWQLQVSAVV